jgi:hypothetical protein
MRFLGVDVEIPQRTAMNDGRSMNGDLLVAIELPQCGEAVVGLVLSGKTMAR